MHGKSCLPQKCNKYSALLCISHVRANETTSPKGELKLNEIKKNLCNFFTKSLKAKTLEKSVHTHEK